MKLVKNWEVKASLFAKLRNLYKKGGWNPAFYIYRYRFNHPKVSHVDKYPIDVIAEITNACNLKCTMCFHADDALPITKTTTTSLMKMETFTKIVDESARNGLSALKLSWRGEPMLHKKFIEMIRYAKQRGILEVTTLTNGTLMDEAMCRAIVDSGLDQIVISIDGFTKGTFEKIRVGADYGEVLRNVETLIKIRGKNRKPFIRLQYTESETNKHETSDFFSFWKDKVDEISISYVKEFSSKEKEDARAAEIHEFCCPQLFQRLVIMTDGTVTVCATDVMGNIAIGNVNETSIENLWHGPKLTALRELHTSGNYFKNPMCRICVNHLFEANKISGRLR